MSEEEFLWDFCVNTFPNHDPIIYLYTCGSTRSSENAINKALKISSDVFSPAYSLSYLKEILIIFLDFKKSQYFKGEIKIKTLY